MSDISTMLENFISKCASDEELRGKALNIITSSDKSQMPEQLKALAEEAGVPFNAEEAMKLVEDPEVLSALGLGSLGGILGAATGADGAAGGLGDILGAIAGGAAEGGEGAAKEGEAAEGLGGLLGGLANMLGKK